MFDIARQALGAISAVFTSTPPAGAPGRLEVRLLVLLVIASAIVRFWGLGGVGLHGPDEDTVALPAVHLANHGEPLFPSGMYYSRAIVQTYLVAWSIDAFRDSEWAMRLPSAVCGVLVVILAYFVGRRFLQPVWNLAFVASVALLPELIIQSQTARMYIFLVACIAAYLICIFAWERSGRIVHLACALAMMLLGLQFQTLMIFAALLLLYPGLLRADFAKLVQGGGALVVSLLVCDLIYRWNAGFYLSGDLVEMARLLGIGEGAAPVAANWRPDFQWPLVTGALLAAAMTAWFAARHVMGKWGRVTAGVTIFLGLCAQFMLSYHLALVFLLIGGVVAVRNRLRSPASLWVVAGVSVIGAAVHVTWLNAMDLGSRGVILGTMMGRASIWSFILYAPVSYAGAAFATIGAVVALWRVARRQEIPDVWLFALLGVWAPLFLIGCLDVYPEYRYMTGVLLPLLIAAFATCQWLCGLLDRATAFDSRRRTHSVLAITAVVLVVNPVMLAKAVSPGYDVYPDHRGAGEYIRSLQPGPNDVLIAEDAIMQTYYLGRVDYLLTNVETALKFSYVANGEVREIYSNARIIATPERLEALLMDKGRGDLYIIGSGENFSDGHRWQRSTAMEGILKTLDVVYEGRDGLTAVWKAPSLRGD